LKRSLFLQAYDLMSYTAYVLHSVEDFEKISNWISKKIYPVDVLQICKRAGVIAAQNEGRW